MNGVFWSLDRAAGYIQFSIFLAIIALSLLPNLFSKKYENQLQKVIMFLLVMGLVVSYLAWWFGSTPSDIGRHQFPFAIVIRIIFIFSSIYLTQILVNKLKSLNQ
jgi:spore maturation protein SpmB